MNYGDDEILKTCCNNIPEPVQVLQDNQPRDDGTIVSVFALGVVRAD